MSAPGPVPPERRLLLEGVGARDVKSLAGYRSRRGYEALERALKSSTPEAVLAEVQKANVRGRGGAGFSAGR